MAQYVEIEAAISMTGMRVVLTPGVPGPWSEAARGILRIKKIPYVKVRQQTGTEGLALAKWTAQTSAPVWVYNDERPRSLWNDQLYLAERLAPEPALIPDSLDERATMFGLSNELCGENGLGWARRLMMFHVTLSNPNAREDARKAVSLLGVKYGYSPQLVERAPARTAEVLRALAAQLARQHAGGSRFMIGQRLSALDVYWAAFAALIEPLPDELCALSPGLRRMYKCDAGPVQAAMTPELLAHRDFIYKEYLQLPVDLSVEKETDNTPRE